MRAVVALVGLATLVLGAPCAAQTRSSHEVRITVPTVLRLCIGDGTPESAAEVRLSIEVAAGNARFEPDHSRVHILANTRWQLTAAFAPAPGSERLALGYAVDDGTVTQPATAFAPVILRGEATAGWCERVVRYELISVPTNGNYGGIITYTLSRP